MVFFHSSLESPLRRFKKNRRGYYSFLIFTCLFLFSLFAEPIFNDKPLFIKYKEKFYFPIIITYPETEFGGIFDTEADYTDPFVTEQIEKDGYLVQAFFPHSYDTILKDSGKDIVLSPPSAKHWLGVDDQARDVLSRVVYGFRLSVIFAGLLVLFSGMIGILAGLVQGYFGGWLDLIFQRVLEVWESVPILYLLIILSNLIRPNFWNLLFLIGAFSWVGYVGLIRAEVLRARNFDFVRTARALGASNFRIMIKHILPNALVATLTFLPFNLSAALMTLASLDFLGLGLPGTSPSLGELIYQGKKNLQAPWLGITGFTVLALILVLLIFIGEGIRDSLDPHKISRRSSKN